DARGVAVMGARLVVAPLDELAGGLAGPEPADLGLIALHQFGVLLVEPLVDLLALDGHLDVLLARPDVTDLDRLDELDRAFLPVGPFRGSDRSGTPGSFGRVGGFAGRGVRGSVVGHRCGSVRTARGRKTRRPGSFGRRVIIPRQRPATSRPTWISESG